MNGLLGFDLHKRTIGIVGCGKIGSRVAKIADGFGMNVLLADPNPDSELERYGKFTDIETVFISSDIVTLHCPLNEQTYHIVDDQALSTMKAGAMLVNTSRGALVDTAAVIRQLKTSKLGSLAIDVYEEEAGMFFHDRSSSILKDDVFARLTTFNNVLITGHQAFFTHEALTEIAETTVGSILAFANNEMLKNSIESVAV